MNPAAAALSIILLHAILCFQGTHSRSISVTNNCRFPVWPAVEATKKSARCPAQINMEETLKRQETAQVWVPNIWRGKIWARTRCADDDDGNIRCATGDCGTGKLECDGASGAPPFTTANFELNANAGKDAYRVSLASGFNVPMEITPGSSDCEPSACKANINQYCPEERQKNGAKGRVLGCRGLGYFEYDSFFADYCAKAVSRSDSSEKCKDVKTDYTVTFCP